MNDDAIETKNAVVINATLDIEEHGFLTVWLTLDFGDFHQGFGGYVLHSPNPNWKTIGDPTGLFIYRTLEVVGVSQWAALVGEAIRARISESKVHAIGHIVADRWFDPEAEFDKLR